MHGVHGAAVRDLHLDDGEADQNHATDVEEQRMQPRPHLSRSAIHLPEDQDQRAGVYGQNAGGQHHVGRAENLDVEAIGGVPPVIERRRCDHGDPAPRRKKSAQRTAKSPDRDRTRAQRRAAVQRSRKNQVAAGETGKCDRGNLPIPVEAGVDKERDVASERDRR